MLQEQQQQEQRQQKQQQEQQQQQQQQEQEAQLQEEHGSQLGYASLDAILVDMCSQDPGKVLSALAAMVDIYAQHPGWDYGDHPHFLQSTLLACCWRWTVLLSSAQL